MEIKENIELSKELKKRLKIYATLKESTMKDLVIESAEKILHNDSTINRSKRAEKNERTSFILNINDELKNEIRLYTKRHKVKIRDFWIFSIKQAIQEE